MDKLALFTSQVLLVRCFAPNLTEVHMADARAAPRTCQCQACRLETGHGWAPGQNKGSSAKAARDMLRNA